MKNSKLGFFLAFLGGVLGILAGKFAMENWELTSPLVIITGCILGGLLGALISRIFKFKTKKQIKKSRKSGWKRFRMVTVRISIQVFVYLLSVSVVMGIGILIIAFLLTKYPDFMDSSWADLFIPTFIGVGFFVAPLFMFFNPVRDRFCTEWDRERYIRRKIVFANKRPGKYFIQKMDEAFVNMFVRPVIIIILGAIILIVPAILWLVSAMWILFIMTGYYLIKSYFLIAKNNIFWTSIIIAATVSVPAFYLYLSFDLLGSWTVSGILALVTGVLSGYINTLILKKAKRTLVRFRRFERKLTSDRETFFTTPFSFINRPMEELYDFCEIYLPDFLTQTYYQ